MPETLKKGHNIHIKIPKPEIFQVLMSDTLRCRTQTNPSDGRHDKYLLSYKVIAVGETRRTTRNAIT